MVLWNFAAVGHEKQQTNKQPIGIPAGYCIRHFFGGRSYLVVTTSFPMFVDCSLLFCLLVCPCLPLTSGHTELHTSIPSFLAVPILNMLGSYNF